MGDSKRKWHEEDVGLKKKDFLNRNEPCKKSGKSIVVQKLVLGRAIFQTGRRMKRWRVEKKGKGVAIDRVYTAA